MLIKCLCNHCDGCLEFESSEAGKEVQCPQCGMDTALYIPHVTIAEKQRKHSTTYTASSTTPAAPALTASKGLDAGSDTVRKIQLLGVTPFDLPALNAAGLCGGQA